MGSHKVAGKTPSELKTAKRHTKQWPIYLTSQLSGDLHVQPAVCLH